MPKSFLEYLKGLNESAYTRDLSYANWLVESAKIDKEAITKNMIALGRDEIKSRADLIMSMVKQKLFKKWPMWRPFWTAREPIGRFGAGSKGPDGIGTMSTDGRNIYYCPAFVVQQYEIAKIAFADEFSKVPAENKTPAGIPKINLAISNNHRHPIDYIVFVVLHEILHCSLKHFLRKPEYTSNYLSPQQLHDLWNIAADYEVNHYLLDDPSSSLYVMPDGLVRADEGYFKADNSEDLKLFTTSFAEKIFERLVRNLEEKMANQQKDKGDSGEDQDSGEDGDQGGEDQNGDDGNGGEDGEPGGGDSGDDGEEPNGGNGDEGDDDDGPPGPGDVIYDEETGQYGIVNRVTGSSVEWTEISEDEAKKRMNG